MASALNATELTSCRLRCLELLDNLNSAAPLPSDLQPNVWNILCAFNYIKKKLHYRPAVIENFSGEQRESLLSIFKTCSTGLDELQNLCNLYRECTPAGWKLNNKEAEQALHLDVATNPFRGIGEIISCIAYIIPRLLDNKNTDEEHPQAWDDLTKSISDNINELRRIIDIVGELARVNLFATQIYQQSHALKTAPATDKADCHCNGRIKSVRHGDDEAWTRLREDLAAEGIFNGAIEGIEDHLKDCVRNLVQGKTPYWEPLGHSTTSKSISGDNPASSTATISEVDSSPNAMGGSLNAEVVIQHVEAEFAKMLPGNYDEVAPEIIETALHSEKAFRQVLRIMVDSACGDPSRAAIYARFAKNLQKSMPSNTKYWGGQVQNGQGPVTEYLWNICCVQWNNGKHNRPQINAEHFALGLSCFMGELFKHKVIKTHYVHSLLRKLLKSDPPVGMTQFVALYQFLRIVGCQIEGGSRISEDMTAHFERIDAIINSVGTSKQLRTLGLEMKDMRKHGWKAEKRRVVSKALRQAMDEIKQLSRMTSSPV
ncbi:Eukaryotic translation initiation factor 4 gamma [Cytospora mali]|uniref:Eukaryotic translation initiation factor 4 gamma n=1 Tax=Cytospora mali TaxID=578113 RepID=A0A194W9H5_CYTMA|nr:Eukaryotic translation initiation factor 4 gamma [Valsa mali]